MDDKIPTSNTQPALILLGGDRRRRRRRRFFGGGDVSSLPANNITPSTRRDAASKVTQARLERARKGCVNRTHARELGAARQASGCCLIKEEHLQK